MEKTQTARPSQWAFSFSKKQLAWSLLGVAVTLLLPLILSSNFLLSLLVLAILFACVSTAWDWVGGYTGQLSLGHSIFFGLGAYASVVSSTHFNLPPWLAMLFAVVLAAAVSFVLFYPVFKATLSGPYFALTTMGFAVIFELLASNIEALNGSNGLMVPLKEPGLYWLQYFDQTVFYYLVVALLVATVIVSRWLQKSTFGYQLAAIRTDSNAAHACGINVVARQTQIMMISAAFTAIGGVLYAQIITHVDPKTFGVEMAIAIILPAIIGGQRWLFGALVGAVFLELMNLLLRITFGGDIPAMNHLVYGVLIIIVVLVMPNGILPKIIHRRDAAHRN